MEILYKRTAVVRRTSTSRYQSGFIDAIGDRLIRVRASYLEFEFPFFIHCVRCSRFRAKSQRNLAHANQMRPTLRMGERFFATQRTLSFIEQNASIKMRRNRYKWGARYVIEGNRKRFISLFHSFVYVLWNPSSFCMHIGEEIMRNEDNVASAEWVSIIIWIRPSFIWSNRSTEP